MCMSFSTIAAAAAVVFAVFFGCMFGLVFCTRAAHNMQHQYHKCNISICVFVHFMYDLMCMNVMPGTCKISSIVLATFCEYWDL